MKDDNKEGRSPQLPDKKNSKPIITVDYELYAHHLEKSDLPLEQKVQFVQDISDIIGSLIALNYRVHPLEKFDNECGKAIEELTKSSFSNADVIDCKGSKVAEDFSRVANSNVAPSPREVEQ